MHSEWFELSLSAADQILAARDAGRRIVAVGTTSLRVLEAACRRSADHRPQAASGWTDLFLYPPAEFFATDAIITNFHMPESTLQRIQKLEPG